MDFMTLFCGIPFFIVLILFIVSLKKKIFTELSLPVKIFLVFASLVPIWGVILAIFGIVYLIHDLKKLNK